VRGRDRQVEEMRLVRRDHEDEIARQLAARAQAAALVAGAQRVGEIAARPRMGVDRVLDRHHLVEVAFAHRRELGEVLEYGAHLVSSSCLVNATLSRTYTGAASAASTPSPAASRGAASCATATAPGWMSGRIFFKPMSP